MSDYDSDDVPEAISFAQSKTEALEKFQEASKSIKEEKQKLKEKRKKRDEIFKAQKKEKLERFVIKSSCSNNGASSFHLFDVSSTTIQRAKVT